MESSVSVQPGPEQQDAPLTEEERKLLTRLLSDPTYFPLEFRTWIKNYVETAGISLPASAIVGGSQKLVNLPIGCVLVAAGNLTAPNAMLCDGRSLLRADYPKLFTAIGTTWGSTGGTFFNIPDFRDRALYMVGTFITLGGTDAVAAGSRGGPRHSHTLSATSSSAGAHGHNVSASGGGSTDTAPQHDHGPAVGGGFALNDGQTIVINSSSGTSRYYVINYTSGTDMDGAHTHSVSVNVSGGADVQGAHTHAVSGSTSGGFLVDRPSYAGVNIYIVTDV